ncbi:MAG: hypothetical protein U0S12_12590 [Fimbriimonadales bacterium]
MAETTPSCPYAREASSRTAWLILGTAVGIAAAALWIRRAHEGGVEGDPAHLLSDCARAAQELDRRLDSSMPA